MVGSDTGGVGGAMRTPIVIIGAGGFGREVLDVLDAMTAVGSAEWDFLGFVDDGRPDPGVLSRLGERCLGGREQLKTLPAGTAFVVAIADSAVRRQLAETATAAGLIPATLIHPSATIGRDVEIGSGTVVCSGVAITTNIRVGRHCHLHVNVTVGHDCRLADLVAVNPLAGISGSVTIGEGVMVGTGASILQGLTLGSGAIVGAGAVVVRDVPADATAVGVPAKSRM